MSIATIVPANAVIGQAVNIRPMETDIVSLDDRLLQAFPVRRLPRLWINRRLPTGLRILIW